MHQQLECIQLWGFPVLAKLPHTIGGQLWIDEASHPRG